jgi:hypothetical protein
VTLSTSQQAPSETPAQTAADPAPTAAALTTAAPPDSAAAAPPASSAAPASGTGSVSVSISSPVSVSGTVPANVTCVSEVGYRAEVASAVIHGDQVSYTVAIARYRGPGSYPAVVAVTLRQATGTVTTLAGVSRVPASITATGGSFSVSATSSEGRTFSGSLTWTCGT